RPLAVGGGAAMGPLRAWRHHSRALDAVRGRRPGAADPPQHDAGVAGELRRMAEPRFPEIAGARTVAAGDAADRLREWHPPAVDSAAAAARPGAYDLAAHPAQRSPRDCRAAGGGRRIRQAAGGADGAARAVASDPL